VFQSLPGFNHSSHPDTTLAQDQGKFLIGHSQLLSNSSFSFHIHLRFNLSRRRNRLLVRAGSSAVTHSAGGLVFRAFPASIVVLLNVLPRAALVELLADVDVHFRRNRDLDDVAVGHGDLDGRVGVPEAVPGPLEPLVVQKFLKIRVSWVS